MDGGGTEIVGGGPGGQWDDQGIAIWSFLLFGCFLLNATLLLAFLFRPGLRTISNRFVMNLTASNLLTCAVLNPLLIVEAARPAIKTSPDEEICAIAEGATAVIATSSILSVLLIAVDQYFAVVDPLRYRSRIDKPKSGVLILSVWLISLVFGLVASFNPNPRSVWRFCSTIPRNSTPNVSETDEPTVIDTLDSISRIFDDENRTAAVVVSRITDTIETAFVEENFESEAAIVTYGLAYAIVHSVLAYLLPLAGVCWIYVSIYFAAHRNSERTRRSGSRPILSSSASFCEEQRFTGASSTRQTDQLGTTIEDLRRIPKISSLSSIDETSETNTATVAAATTMLEENPVVFTVGSRRIELSSSPQSSESIERVPVAALKAEFLERNDNNGEDRYEDLVKSKFLDPPDHRRKSSHDLMHEKILAEAAARDARWLRGDAESADSSDSEIDFDVQEPRTLSPYMAYEIAPTHDEEDGDPLKMTTCDVRNEKDETIFDNVPNEASVRLEIEEENAQTKSSLRKYLESNIDYSNSNNSKEHVKEPSSCLLAPIVTITPAAPNRRGSVPTTSSSAPMTTLRRVSSARSTSSYIVSLRHRISNGSLFRYREETRAARIGALVIVMGLICWSPYVVLLLLKNVPSYRYRDLPREYDVSALSLIVLAAYVSPLLFGYRSRRVKRELRKFFCFRRELSYKNNRSLMAKKVLKRRHSAGTPSHLEMDNRYANIFNCVYGRSRWPKEKVQFVQVPDTALVVDTCRSSFSSGASTQISSTSTEDCC